MKSFKNFSTMLLILLVSVLGITTVFADSSLESKLDYSTYLELQKEGVVGEDVTYEALQEMQLKSKELEKQLEEDINFVEMENLDIKSSSASLRAGDIVITNATSSFGITGHTGIAISSNQILHIEGPGKVPRVISITNWNYKYSSGWTKVYRNTMYSRSLKASRWAESTYIGSNVPYAITMDLSTTHETYCSKLVWQAYYYGVGTSHANGPTWGLRAPYDLPTTVKNLYFEGNLY